MFKGKKGQSLVQQIGKRSNTFVPGSSIPGKPGDHAKMFTATPAKRSQQEAIAVKKCIYDVVK